MSNRKPKAAKARQVADDELLPDEWARWALLGDAHAPAPNTLMELNGRIATAIRSYGNAVERFVTEQPNKRRRTR